VAEFVTERVVLAEVQDEWPVVWAADLDTSDSAGIWEETWGGDGTDGAVLRCDVDRDGDWTTGIEIARDETAWLGSENPKVTEGLEMAFVVQDGSWEDGIEGAK
jgi:hypothetical protein